MVFSRIKGNKKLRMLLVGALAAVLALTALVLFLGGRGLTTRYDDREAILSGYDSAVLPEVTSAGGGGVTVRLTHDDIYWYANKYGLLSECEEALRDMGITASGFRIAGGKLTVFARRRFLGILPLSYRAVMSLTWDGGVVLQAQKVYLGTRITLPKSRWPSALGRSYFIPAEDISAGVTNAALDGEALLLTHKGLGGTLPRELHADADLLHAMALFAVKDENAAVEQAVRSAENGVITPADAEGLIGELGYDAMDALLRLALPSDLPLLWAEADPFTRDLLVQPLIRTATEQRAALEAALAAEQSRYAKVLTAVRESYKSGGLRISDTGFVSVTTGKPYDIGQLTQLSATATDSRIVFLYSGSDAMYVCTDDMPANDTVARTGKRVMEGLLEPGRVYDLGVALSSEGDVPLLLYRRADGALVLREIGSALYVSLLVEHSTPVLDADTLPTPGRRIARSAGEGWSGAVILTEN